MVRAVFDELDADSPRRRFTVGINDDVTDLSLPVDDGASTTSRPRSPAPCSTGWARTARSAATRRPSASSATRTDLHCQGHFVYDSKKSGATTVSHLRFGPDPIRSTYEIRRADFVAVHDPAFLDRLDVLDRAAVGATVLINTPAPADEVWDQPAPACPGGPGRTRLLGSVRDRRPARRRGARAGPAHQHRHVDLLLRVVRGAAPRRGDRRGQGSRSRRHVGPARSRDRAPQRRGDRRRAGRAARGRARATLDGEPRAGTRTSPTTRPTSCATSPACCSRASATSCP